MMTTWKFVATAVALGLALGSPAEGAQRQATEAESSVIKEAVAEKLKDPESARFGKIIVNHDTKGLLTACGMVNAKNSYGGYVGMSPFLGSLIVRDGKPIMFAVVGLTGADISGEAVLKVCSQYGITL